MKKIICLGLALIMSLSMTAFASEIKGFSDVAETDWSYSYIMLCVEHGAIDGTTPPDENGIGTFEPEQEVTLGQFLAALTKLLCPSAIMPLEDGVHWTLPYYDAAVKEGLIKETDFDYTDINKNLSREDMAYILVSSAKYNGEVLTSNDGIENSIADYATIHENRKDAVKKTYSNGLITGIDEKGTFAPANTMTREQMATVICRLMNYTERPDISSTDSSASNCKATGHSYTEKVVAPTTSAKGYTLHTCSKCGTSYKDSYVDKLPTQTTTPSNPGNTGDTGYEEGGWKGDDYGSGEKIEGNEQIAGQFVDHKGYSRKFYTDGMTAADARTALNSYVGYVYGRRFFSDGISINDADTGKFAKIVTHEDGRLGVNVFGWRKSYDSDVVQNSCINMVMEAFYFFTEDRDVAYALWNVVDYLNINGSAATTVAVVEGFGFTCSNETNNGIDLSMNGVHIRWEWGAQGAGDTFYFG